MKPYVSTLFKTPQEFEEWIRYNNHENKEALDTITAQKIDEWDKKGCNLAFDKNSGKINLLAANGAILATVDTVKCDEETVIRDEATGAITVKGIKDSNSGKTFNLWVGTTEAYKAIALIDPNTIYCFTDDTTLDDINATLADHEERLDEIQTWKNGIANGRAVKKAEDANTFSGKELNCFRGHGTSFYYREHGKYDINKCDREAHCFVREPLGTLPDGFSGGGCFLDVDYFDGQDYAPHASGEEPISVQTLREADGSKAWVRTLNHNISQYVNPNHQWGEWIQTHGHSINSFSPTSFRGHGTNFSYEPLVQNNIDYKGNFEGHYFVINAKGTLPSNFGGHGFLDVELFGGEEFAPNGQGKEKICRQTLREYKTAKTWVRTYNHNAVVGGVWTAWEQTAGDGAIVSRAVNADKAISDSNGNKIIDTYATIYSSTYNSASKVWNFNIGNTLTLFEKAKASLYTIGTELEGLYMAENPICAVTTEQDATIAGKWRVCGVTGVDYENISSIRGYYYIIQRIS